MGNGDETPLGAKDLQSYPDILLVWGPTDALTGAADLYVAPAGGTAVRSLRRWPRRPDRGLSRPYGAFDAIWSPNRDSIAVELGVWAESDPRSRIALIDPLGRDLQIITPGDDVYLYGWSGDGVSVIAREAGFVGRFRALPVAGGPAIPLRIAGSRHLGVVDWSPDGTRIAAYVGQGIVTMNADGSDVTRVTRDGVSPHWSPDGRWILFTRRTYDEETDEETASNVFKIRANGQEERQLTTDGSSEALDWSPDGRFVLFRRCCEAAEAKPRTEGRTLWVMDAEGKRQTRLHFNKEGWDVLSADWGR